MTKIAIVTNSASSLLNFRKDLILLMNIKNFQVFCFAADFDDSTETAVKLMGGIPIRYPLARTGLNPVKDIKNMFTLTKLLKDLQPDIVFATFSKPVIFGTIAARKAKVKRAVGMLEGLGYTFTELPEGQSLKRRLIKSIQVLLYKMSLPKLDRLIFLNNDDPRDLLHNYNIKVGDVKVLGGIGLSFKDFKYVKPVEQPISFIFVGRLLREKGIFEYLKAAERIKKKHSDVIYYIVGGLDEENPGGLRSHELDSYINKGIVVYAGHVSNVNEWIQQSSIFVLPSYYREGVPRSTQEAMATGRPVITTDVPGCRDTVEDGKNGFLINKWSIDELEEKMLYFINNPALITQMGLESHKIARANYDGEVVNEKLLNYIIGADKTI